MMKTIRLTETYNWNNYDAILPRLSDLSSKLAGLPVDDSDIRALQAHYSRSTSKDLANPTIRIRPIDYQPSTKHAPFGRVYGSPGCLQLMRKSIRSMLLRPEDPSRHVYELDMYASHISIIAELGCDSDFVHTLHDYLDNRAKYYDIVTSCYQLNDNGVFRAPTTDEAKRFLTSLVYGSGAKCQLEEMHLTRMRKRPSDQFKDVSSKQDIQSAIPLEILTFQQAISTLELQIMGDLPEIARRVPCSNAVELSNALSGNTVSVIFSYIVQEVECAILFAVKDYMEAKGVRIRTLIHDGAVIELDPVTVNVAELTNDLTSSIRSKFGFKYIKFVAKNYQPTDEHYQLWDTMLLRVQDPLPPLQEAQDSLLSQDAIPLSDVGNTFGAIPHIDLYKAHLMPSEKALISDMSYFVKLMDNVQNIHCSFTVLENSYHIINLFSMHMISIFKEYHTVLTKLRERVELDRSEALQDIKVFATHNNVSDDITEAIEYFGGSAKRKGGITDKNVHDFIDLFNCLKHQGLVPSRHYMFTMHNPDMIDLTTPPGELRDELLVHFPLMHMLWTLSGIDKIVTMYFKLTTDYTLTEFEIKPVFTFTHDEDDCVSVLERQPLSECKNVRGQLGMFQKAFLIPIMTSGKIADKIQMYTNVFDFVNFHHTSGGLIRGCISGPIPHGINDHPDLPKFLSTMKHPLYAHILQSRLQDCKTHAVNHNVRITLDRLFCHLAGCIACHCADCRMKDTREPCHHCQPEDSPCSHACERDATETQCRRLRRWYAWVITRVSRPVRIACLLYSRKGGQGKSLLFSALPLFLMGTDLAVTDKDSSYFLDNFNSVLEGKRLLVVNEANCGPKEEQKLLGLIDQDQVLIQKKYHDRKTTTFLGALGFCSNYFENFPRITQESRKFDGFIASDKRMKPGYQEEVLENIFLNWLSPSVGSEKRNDIIMDIISYLHQAILAEGPTLMYLPDVFVKESYLLQRLCYLQPIAMAESELYEKFFSPLQQYIRKSKTTAMFVKVVFTQLTLFNMDANDKAILQRINSKDMLDEILGHRQWGNYGRKVQMQSPGSILLLSVSKASTMSDDVAIWPHAINFEELDTRHTNSTSFSSEIKTFLATCANFSKEMDSKIPKHLVYQQ